jgi:hypothetical protein
LDFDWIEGFDGMDLDAGQSWIDDFLAVARVHRMNFSRHVQSADLGDERSDLKGATRE